MVTGIEHPAPRVNGTADRFRHVGARIVLPAGGVAVRGRGCPRTGSGVPAAGPLIIPLPIGGVRPGAGVIRSRLVLSLCGSGFAPPYEISYRGVKLPRVSAALGCFWLRRGAGLPQVGERAIEPDAKGRSSREANLPTLCMVKSPKNPSFAFLQAPRCSSSFR